MAARGRAIHIWEGLTTAQRDVRSPYCRPRPCPAGVQSVKQTSTQRSRQLVAAGRAAGHLAWSAPAAQGWGWASGRGVGWGGGGITVDSSNYFLGP